MSGPPHDVRVVVGFSASRLSNQKKKKARAQASRPRTLNVRREHALFLLFHVFFRCTASVARCCRGSRWAKGCCCSVCGLLLPSSLCAGTGAHCSSTRCIRRSHVCVMAHREERSPRRC
jgi:hypothetical protein